MPGFAVDCSCSGATEITDAGIRDARRRTTISSVAIIANRGRMESVCYQIELSESKQGRMSGL